MGLLLIIWKKLPLSLRCYSPVILNIIIGFAFPFFFSFMYFKNNGGSLWQVNELVALVVLTFFTDWITYGIIVISTITCAGIFYVILTPAPALPENIISAFGSYSAPIIYFIIFRRQNDKLHDQQLKTVRALSAAIAHEMRTPLLILSTVAHRLRKHLPPIIEGCQKAIETKIASERTKRNIMLVQDAPDSIQNTTRRTFVIIDMLLMNLKGTQSTEIAYESSLSLCIEEALKEYPFQGNEKNLVKWQRGNDFKFKGHSLMIKHVLFNLLKNALYYVKAAGKGTITVWLETGEKYNTLHFKDTGKGISAEMLPHIFDQFFTRRKYGVGIGLAFCRQVMEDLNGSIRCNSIKGEYTHFILSFPKTL